MKYPSDLLLNGMLSVAAIFMSHFLLNLRAVHGCSHSTTTAFTSLPVYSQPIGSGISDDFEHDIYGGTLPDTVPPVFSRVDRELQREGSLGGAMDTDRPWSYSWKRPS
jgi:hypothetical protein